MRMQSPDVEGPNEKLRDRRKKVRVIKMEPHEDQQVRSVDDGQSRGQQLRIVVCHQEQNRKAEWRDGRRDARQNGLLGR